LFALFISFRNYKAVRYAGSGASVLYKYLTAVITDQVNILLSAGCVNKPTQTLITRLRRVNIIAKSTVWTQYV